jgi:hypothetical protein
MEDDRVRQVLADDQLGRLLLASLGLRKAVWVTLSFRIFFP